MKCVFLLLQCSAPVLVVGIPFQGSIRGGYDEAVGADIPIHSVDSEFPGEEPDITSLQSPERHQ